MKTAVIVFPGSICVRDLAVALRHVTGNDAAMVWHGESELPAGLDLIGVPGGFSYGDYLRSGAMAARSPIMRAVVAAAARGVQGETISLPVAHHDGNYSADDETLDRLEGEGRVALRYAESVNGSARQIAGVLNASGNVLGMLPHPERRIEGAHGGTDGLRLFSGLLETIAA